LTQNMATILFKHTLKFTHYFVPLTFRFNLTSPTVLLSCAHFTSSSGKTSIIPAWCAPETQIEKLQAQVSTIKGQILMIQQASISPIEKGVK
jgi:hypothetical protein